MGCAEALCCHTNHTPRHDLMSFVAAELPPARNSGAQVTSGAAATRAIYLLSDGVPNGGRNEPTLILNAVKNWTVSVPVNTVAFLAGGSEPSSTRAKAASLMVNLAKQTRGVSSTFTAIVRASNSTVAKSATVLACEAKCSSQTSSSACKDTPGFSDAFGTCAMYAAHQWCTVHGTAGAKWQSTWGALDAKVVNACCACGKGAAPPPSPVKQFRPYRCVCPAGKSGPHCEL